jgi:hypothetical protein
MFMSANFLMKLLLSVCLFGQTAFCFDQKYEDRTVFLRSTNLMDQMLHNTGPMTFQNLAKEDVALIEIAKKNADKLQIRYLDSSVSIRYQEMAVHVEMKDHELWIGGVRHQINPDISISENIRNWAKLYLRNQKTSSSRWMSAALPGANAANLPADVIPKESLDKFAAFAAKAVPVAGMGAMAAVGGAAAVGAMAISILVIGAATCEAMARSDAAYFHANVSRERLNCYTGTLSFYGAELEKVGISNPRDRLYLQSLRCDGQQISAQLESNRGLSSTRVFKFANGTLISAEESRLKGRYSKDRENKAVQFSNPPKAEEKKTLEALAPELSAYQNLCQNPEKLAQFRREAEQAHSQKEISTTSPAASKTLGTQ